MVSVKLLTKMPPPMPIASAGQRKCGKTQLRASIVTAVIGSELTAGKNIIVEFIVHQQFRRRHAFSCCKIIQCAVRSLSPKTSSGNIVQVHIPSVYSIRLVHVSRHVYESRTNR